MFLTLTKNRDFLVKVPPPLREGWETRQRLGGEGQTIVLAHTKREILLHIDAIRLGQWAQATLEALLDSAELPFAAMTIEFTKDHCGFDTGIF